MFNRWYIVAVALLPFVVLLAGCSQGTRPEPTDTLHVTVSIVPQKYFVERIGGQHVTVSVMVQPGASPETYEPKPEQLRALSEADAYVSIGLPFEKAWLDRIASTNPNMLMVDTTRGLERMPMGVHHHHGEEERPPEGETENPDPHIWLSPELVKVQAQTIYEALVRLDAAHKETYQANLDSFMADIDALDADICQTLARVENRKFMVFHPAWGYFARDYGLEMISIEVGGQEPSAAELAALISEAREEGIRVIFAQPELSTRTAETVAREIGGEVLLVSPLAPDWLDNLRQVAETFAEVLSE
ncbi:MAG: cation ABC transporter substrate-binding protein [Chloroflexi bacterium]|nr:cation ABC transporter substrate-binding protein [Chloroflexota bacterium]